MYLKYIGLIFYYIINSHINSLIPGNESNFIFLLKHLYLNAINYKTQDKNTSGNWMAE